MGYRERHVAVDRTVLWQRDPTGAPGQSRILPDGCLDIIWDGRRLFVAGPDSMARMHSDDGHAAYTALRFSAGLGPALLGVPAAELRDQTPDLDTLWPSRDARELAERITANPAVELERWVLRRSAVVRVDPLGDRIVRLAGTGMRVTEIADGLGMGTRKLHRHCLALFGYGPAQLAQILRMQRALHLARSGTALADVAASCGYADQPHLTRDIHTLAGTSPRALLRELPSR